MGIFDKIKEASVSRDGNFPRIGTYWARIGAVKVTQKFTGEQFVAIEMSVVRSLDSSVENPHKPGEDITHLLKVAQEMFLPNMKQFIAASLGCSPDEVGPKEAEHVTSDEQPMAGLVVEFAARNTKTRKNTDFTKIVYKREVPAEELAAYEAEAA